MTENRFTKSNRDTVVTSIRIERTEPGDLGHPNPKYPPPPDLTQSDLEGEIWNVWFHLKTGFDKMGIALFHCKTEKEAIASAYQFPVGSVIPNGGGPYPMSLRELFEMKGDKITSLFAAGDNDFFKCYDALEGAGIKGKDALTSQKVRDWFDQEYTAWMKETFGENWSIVAEFEYCLNHFPRSSMAFIAAQIHFSYYVAEDDFSAAYLLRELEMIMGGAEEIAASTLDLRTKAGKGGSRASQLAKRRRLDMFMNEIEILGDLFPRIGEQAIVDQAFKNAVASDEMLWRQGKGQQAEYEIELRSDDEFRDRYFSIFCNAA